MALKRIVYIVVALAAVVFLIYYVSSSFTNSRVITEEYKDPTFEQIHGVPEKSDIDKEIAGISGRDVTLSATLNGRSLSVTGKMINENPDLPYTHDNVYKKVVYVPITIFRKFPHITRVRCIVSNKKRNYGLDVTRNDFEDYVGISSKDDTNSWHSNVISMLVYDKINRDDFFDMYGLYKPEY